MNTPESLPPHKLGANRHDPAHKHRAARRPTAESRDVREDRSTRQGKLMAQPRTEPPAGSGANLLAREKKPEALPSSPKESVKRPFQKPVNFRLRHDSATNVFVAGTFNNWDPARHPLLRSAGGDWTLELLLDAGRHEYLFVADGCWLPDPNSADWVENPFGGRNSVLVV